MRELLTPQGPADAPMDTGWITLALVATLVIVATALGQRRRPGIIAHLERMAVDWEREETSLPITRAAAARFARPALRLLKEGG